MGDRLRKASYRAQAEMKTRDAKMSRVKKLELLKQITERREKQLRIAARRPASHPTRRFSPGI